jgi:tyrosine-protein phosphatase SIW14
MPSRLQLVLAAGALALVVSVPLVYASGRVQHARNMRVVEEGALYRCGQLTPAGLERAIRERGIRTVVTLRPTAQPGDKSPDDWEEKFCAERGVNFRRIPPRVWGADEEGEIAAEQAVREFLAVMDKPENRPVLVHCFAGVHRTGTMCAIYRLEYNGWPLPRALREMHHMGFAPADMHPHIRDYLTNYKPRN